MSEAMTLVPPGRPQLEYLPVGLFGLFFALPLFTLIFSRLLFEPPLPDALKPSLLILAAPFAVGYSTYTVTTEDTDLFAQSLYTLTLHTLTLFILAVLIGQSRHLPVQRALRGD